MITYFVNPSPLLLQHYEGDVSELDLTFSYDEDYLGQVINYELRPGGKGICVSNENRILYIHLMAHFKLYTQIKDQTKAFIRGFRSIIHQDWLSLFSVPEVGVLFIIYTIILLLGLVYVGAEKKTEMRKSALLGYLGFILLK